MSREQRTRKWLIFLTSNTSTCVFFFNIQSFLITMGENFRKTAAKKIHHFPSRCLSWVWGVRGVDKPVLANLQTEPGRGMSLGCINKAKEICNYESRLEIHGCAVPDTCTSSPCSSSAALSDVSAYPHHRVRAEFHGGCAAGKVEGSTADEYANPSGSCPYVPGFRRNSAQSLCAASH